MAVISCVELETLLHHYYRNDEIVPLTPAKEKAQRMLHLQDLLEAREPRRQEESYYVITAKGRFYVEATLSIPFPVEVTTYVIPEA